MLIDHVLLETNGRQLISIGPDASVREALYLLVMHKIGSLPVLDSSGNLVGIFTERDVLLGECGDSEASIVIYMLLGGGLFGAAVVYVVAKAVGK